MNKLNILELHRTINEKKQRKSECYEKVLEICHKKIKTAANTKKYRCLIDLPEYVYGYPLYDMNECIKYVLNSLKNNGFLVTYFFPKILYISWDFEEMKTDKKNKKTTSPIMPVLSSSLIQGKQKTSGKLSVNLQL
jgi:hypothetical protein